MIRTVLFVARLSTLTAAAALAACAAADSDTLTDGVETGGLDETDDDTAGDDTAGDPTTGDETTGDDPSDPDGTEPPRPAPRDATVYAHGPDELFAIDPDTLEAVSIGLFAFDGPPDRITDIAIDKEGAMTGVSLEAVYSIDPDTAKTVLLSTFAEGEGGLTSLSYVPVDIGEPDGAERLVAADFDGKVWQIDPQSGARTLIGNYNQTSDVAIGSSGDIVAVVDFGIVATVNVKDEPNDYLARIDPLTWQATLLGDTGQKRVFGIGFWEGQVYGFTGDNTLITLDATTGELTSTRDSDVEWWGAGVTTLAPIIE